MSNRTTALILRLYADMLEQEIEKASKALKDVRDKPYIPQPNPAGDVPELRGIATVVEKLRGAGQMLIQNTRDTEQ